MNSLLQKALYRLLSTAGIRSYFHTFVLKVRGLRTRTSPLHHSINVDWPHRVKIGERCEIERGVSFKIPAAWQKGLAVEIGDGTFIGAGAEFNIRGCLIVGRDCLIASSTKLVDHNHGMDLDRPMKCQEDTQSDIRLGDDVWIGAAAIILKGVEIGDGAVVAAGAIVNQPIGELEIWGGVPAKLIGKRVK